MSVVPISYPVRNLAVRRSLARRDICPECGGALDTGWECNACDYDAKIEATSAAPVLSSKYLIREGDRAAGAVRDPMPRNPNGGRSDE